MTQIEKTLYEKYRASFEQYALKHSDNLRSGDFAKDEDGNYYYPK